MFMGWRGGGGYSDLCLLSELFFLVQTFEFRNVFSVEFFCFFFQLFYWYVCHFEQVFLWVCQFSQEFWGCQFKNVCFYGVSLILVTVIFWFIDYSRFPLPIKSTRACSASLRLPTRKFWTCSKNSGRD